ncbi:accessory Sec system translocase SecA2 [Bacillus sp. FJAT-45037]|uniref:accessory Sec system translocase SecA2 n=1 Tax=Bacillus sp. FJAT-45037 TaxID=2011007 RepID=UPI000C2331A9|nr:accessory Sec system translocase SecA2 [Bacillus sp. FJAT-45037]
MIIGIKRIVQNFQNRDLKKYISKVTDINDLEPKMEDLSDEQLKEKTTIFKKAIQDGQTIHDLQVEAFAVVREASKRVLGLRHYDVQLIGGLALTDGNISEMSTGEGKTLVASLPSYLIALEGKGVHVITVNEYLANRDRELIGKLHEFLGLTVGLNIPQLSSAEKKEAYNADITYGVGNEFGFDYLRDNMSSKKEDQVQRPFHYALIDEVDSVLIDEAKTPLIIAGKTSVTPNLYRVCAKVASSLKENTDYIYDKFTKATNLTDDGITTIERTFGIDNLYDIDHQTLYHFVLQALRAKVMFSKDVDYIVSDGEIKLVDMFTGRIMDGRTFSDGLHQALEAKENLGITEENKTQAMITIQNYYRMYPTLAGMTGTAKTEEKEFQSLYGMNVIAIPTNREPLRIDRDPSLYLTKEQKYQAVTTEVKKRHQKGQPILIGTSSIIQSEAMARCLEEENVPFQLLNAKSLEKEVKLISLAGQKDQVTIATNMAGRGTDIILGEGVAELGGLYVIGTERHESRRIDNQLKGRSGRQGDPGETKMFTSLEDDIIQRFASEEVEVLQPKLVADSTGMITAKEAYTLVNKAQVMCENQSYSIREYTLKLDDIVNEQRTTVYTLRNNVLQSKDLLKTTTAMIKSSYTYFIDQYCSDHLLPEEWALDELESKLKLLNIDVELVAIEDIDREEIDSRIHQAASDYIARLHDSIGDESLDSTFKNILRMSIDFHWLQHIEEMNRLKEGISLRSYSQEDPIRIFQREGFHLFEQMYRNIELDVSIYVAKAFNDIEHSKTM